MVRHCGFVASQEAKASCVREARRPKGYGLLAEHHLVGAHIGSYRKVYAVSRYLALGNGVEVQGPHMGNMCRRLCRDVKKSPRAHG